MTIDWKVIVPAALASAFLASAATATTVKHYTFHFDNSIGDNQAHVEVESQEDEDVTLHITGNRYSINGDQYQAGSQIDVDSNSYGLISQNRISYDCWSRRAREWQTCHYYEEHTLDSRYTDESFKFVLNGIEDGEVHLKDVEISWSEKWYNNGHQTYRYTSNGDTYGFYDLFADGTHVGNSYYGDVIGEGVSGDEFVVGVRGSNWTETYNYSCKKYFYSGGRKYYYWSTCEGTKYKSLNYGIKIQSITFAVKQEMAPVPLPAAGWLLLGGIGGMAALRRAKKKS